MTDASGLPPIADVERALSLAYAPAAKRRALGLLWRLDEQLGSIVARADNPAVGQMRLTWWHEALRTARETRPVDPLLLALAEERAIELDPLLPLIDGWEVLLDALPLVPEALAQFAELRGGTLFKSVADVLGVAHGPIEPAGRLWALTDLAHRISDRETALRALALAQSVSGRLPRPLAVLTALARWDRSNAERRQGSPARVTRAIVAGLTGL